MKAYKVEVLIIDHDEMGEADIINTIENARYPNHCMSPSVISSKVSDIGGWHDGHPLNQTKTWRESLKNYFL